MIRGKLFGVYEYGVVSPLLNLCKLGVMGEMLLKVLRVEGVLETEAAFI
jgi:hypothetical protein